MATMGFEWSGIGSSYVKDYPSDGGDDVAAGDLIQLNGSGQIGGVAADGAIFGIALKAIGAVANVEIPVQVITTDSVFITTVDGTSVQTIVGEDFGLVYPTTTQCVDLDDVTTTQVRIEQLDTRDGTGKALGRVYVRFMSDDIIQDLG